MTRTYECCTKWCPHFGVKVTVEGESIGGPYYRFPESCWCNGCGLIVRLTEVDGKPVEVFSR